MIFVTVGTHEQPFSRLIREMDRLVEDGRICEGVFIQRGEGTPPPRFCDSADYLSPLEMLKTVRSSRLVVTHGGPGSISMALWDGKIPIIIPRRKCFGEHVDDHQVAFVRHMEKEKRVIAVYEIETLWEKIDGYERLCRGLHPPSALGAGVSALTARLDEYCEGLVRVSGA